jgi:hypothetical protein
MIRCPAPSMLLHHQSLISLCVPILQHELRNSYKHVSDETAKKHWDFW